MDQNPNPSVAPETPPTPAATQVPPSAPKPPRKSLLKNPLFYIVVLLLFIFCIGYYLVYSNLDKTVTQLGM